MATAKLTTTYVEKLPLKDKGYWVNDTQLPGLRLFVGKGGAKIYYISYKNSKGKRDSYKIGDAQILTATQAREAAKKFFADMAVNGTDIKEERKSACEDKRPTLRNLREAYLAAGGSIWTVKMADAFSSFMDKAAEDITPLEIEKWRVAEKERTGNLAVSINRKVGGLKTILNFGVDRGLIQANPIARLKKLKEIDSLPKIRYLTTEERARLLAALDEMDTEARNARTRSRLHANRQHLPSMGGWAFANYFKPLILVSLNTGIRRHALLSLRWEDIDLEHKNITLRALTAKNRKTSIVPMNNVVHDVLCAWYAQRIDPDNLLVFPSPQTGGVMTNCDSNFSELLRRADIKNFRWHDMRHDFASRLVMAGVDLNTVRELMTHSDISMTLRYAHLAPEKKLEAVNRLCND